MKKIIILGSITLSVFASCKKTTECTATANGATTSPVQYSGSESEVSTYENNYISNNEANPLVDANCVRK